MDNKYTGEVKFKMGKETFTFVYDFAALAAIRSKYTQEQIQNVFNESVEMISDVVTAGLKKHHPDFTPEKLLELSPPLMLLCQAVDRALLFAYWGPEEASKIIEQGEKIQKALTGDIEKKAKPGKTK